MAVVIAAYGAYSLLAVPWIEPQAVRHDAQAASDADRAQASGLVEAQRAVLGSWFDEGAWELTSPKILETSQGKLLLKNYQRLPDPKYQNRYLKMEPCSIVFLPEGEFDSEAERNRRAIVLRAPEGAVLQFDRPFDPTRGDFDKPVIVGAKLNGKVTIRSQQRSPGPEDDLWIVTREVDYEGNQITTPHLVEFRLGENQGQGEQLRIDLATPAERASPAAGPQFGAVKRFELARNVRLRMLPGDSELFPSGSSAPRRPSKQPSQPQPPVEITCQGPFQFDVPGSVATFNDRVDVLRLNLNAASDQLTCDKLDLYFESDAKAPAAADQGASPKLRPSRLEARGNPVVLSSPSNGVQARGQRLEYDIQKRSGKLFDKQDAFLREESKAGQPPQEIHARELEFESDLDNPSGPPRKMIAKGEGWLLANASEGPTRPGQKPPQLKASWTHSLTFAPYTEPFAPYQEFRLLSLRGKSHVELPGSGAMDAEEIHVYLEEAPVAPADAASARSAERKKLVPAKLNALGAAFSGALAGQRRQNHAHASNTQAKDFANCARVFSPQLDGVVNEIKVWFQQAAPAPVAALAASPAGPAGAPPQEPAAATEATDPLQHFHVSGDVLQVNALLADDRGGATQITDVILNGQVHCQETRTSRPDEQPLVIEGEQLHLVQHQPENAIATVTGQPATVDARGMRLEGGTTERRGEIHLHRGQNKVWIPGPGFLSLPADRDPQGRPLKKSTNERLKIWWLGRMDFDGLAAEFEDQVTVVHSTSKLLTPLLHVDFTERVRFGASGSNDQPQVKQVVCRQGVEIWNRSFEPPGALASIEHLLAQDLNFVYATGDIAANGPGEVSRVWLDTGESTPGFPGAGAKKKPQPARGRKAAPGLLYLKVKFDRQMQGNQYQQVMHFQNQVRAVYGPVPHWSAQLDPERPKLLDERGFVLTCSRRLTVDQIDTGRQSSSSFELKADGNVFVESSAYSTRSSTLKYERSKDLLTLDGDGYSKAKLFRQPRPGAEYTVLESRNIWFRPSTNDAKLDGFNSFDFIDLVRPKTDDEQDEEFKRADAVRPGLNRQHPGGTPAFKPRANALAPTARQ